MDRLEKPLVGTMDNLRGMMVGLCGGEGKLRPDRIQYIIAAPPVCQTVEEWVEKYAPRRHDGQARGPSGDATRHHDLQEIGGQLITASGSAPGP